MRLFQIIRLDNDLIEKVNLQIGNNIIGLGAATGRDDDPKMKHAFMIHLAPNDEMTITPALPCYMKAKTSRRWQLLKLGVTVPIKPGEICSLLPRTCWFKIVSMDANMDVECQSATKRKADENLADIDIAEKKPCLESQSNLVDNTESVAKPPSIEILGDGTESVAKFPSTDGTEQTESKNDCEKSTPKEEQHLLEALDSGQKLGHESKNADNSCDGKIEQQGTTEVYEGPYTSLECDKQAQGDSGPVQEIVRVSIPQTQSSNTDSCDQEGSGKLPENRFREKCKYGEKCYRRNPEHKAKYSHPGDADYDEPDDREECPYGKKCYRKNPQHRAKFRHTTKGCGTKAARSKQGEEKLSRRKTSKAKPRQDDVADLDDFLEEGSEEESVDESEYEPSSESEENSDEELYSESSGIEWEDETVV